MDIKGVHLLPIEMWELELSCRVEVDLPRQREEKTKQQHAVLSDCGLITRE